MQWKKMLVLMMALTLSFSFPVKAEELSEGGEVTEKEVTEEETETDGPKEENVEEEPSEGENTDGEVDQEAPKPEVNMGYTTFGDKYPFRAMVNLGAGGVWEGAPDYVVEIYEALQEDSSLWEELSWNWLWVVESVAEGECLETGSHYLTKEEWDKLTNLCDTQTSSRAWENQTDKSEEARIAFRENVLKCYQDFKNSIHITKGINVVVPITSNSGTIQDAYGNTIQVKLQIDPRMEKYAAELETVLMPALKTKISSEADGYQMAGIQDISIVDVQKGTLFMLEQNVDIVIPYPDGYGINDEFMVFHWNGTGWDALALKGKEEGGLVCEVDSLSPFAIAGKKAADSGSTSVPEPTPNPEPSDPNPGSSGSLGGEAEPESMALKNIPQTGDGFPMEWMAILGIAAAAVMGTELYAKGKRNR